MLIASEVLDRCAHAPLVSALSCSNLGRTSPRRALRARLEEQHCNVQSQEIFLCSANETSLYAHVLAWSFYIASFPHIDAKLGIVDTFTLLLDLQHILPLVSVKLHSFQ